VRGALAAIEPARPDARDGGWTAVAPSTIAVASGRAVAIGTAPLAAASVSTSTKTWMSAAVTTDM